MSNHANHINNTFRLDFSAVNITLPNQSNPFLDIYTYSGGGFFHGFTVRFNDEKIVLRLEVDGNEVFEIDVK